LFNRLAGKKLAIVADIPGVTRDRREAHGRLGDLDLALIDTAGFEDVKDASLEARMRVQTEAAVADADAVLFLIDARVGVTPLDEAFAALLRRAGKPVIVVANKAEGRAGEAGVHEAYALGLGEPVPVSAEHGEGMGELYAAVAEAARGREGAAREAGEKPINLAIIGRPNAGKSTLVNALIGEERVLVGPEAGITRDAIAVDWLWGGKPYRLIDTAGMRRKAKVQAKLEKLSVAETLHAIRFADVCVLVMDAAEAFEKQDLAIADLVVREGRALVLALAKWDKIENPRAHFEEMQLVAKESLPQARGAPLVTVAALSGVGLDRLMKAVEEARTDWTARVKTKDLNDWLHAIVARHPPPAVRGKRIKPRYLTQIKARPPTFVLFASRADAMPESYKRYLINALRDAFDLHAAPVRLIVRQSANPFAEGE
jgi:GTP-binding protein